MKAAFVIWNPFQDIQFKNLYPYFNDRQILILKKNYKVDTLFSSDMLKSNYVKVINKESVTKLDGFFDVLFFQSPFFGIEDFSNTHLVAVQYGLAKENHNYGTWRSLADINFVYGSYSHDIVKFYTPTFMVGNPKFDSFYTYTNYQTIVENKKKNSVDSSKKTILYMPTYGELGSFNEFVYKLKGLSDTYNILIKFHHNDFRRYDEYFKICSECGIEHLYPGSYDQLELLSICDCVISDFSGAIFDAMYAEKPIILFQNDIDSKVGIQKFDKNSLEYLHRNEIGLIINKDDNLDNAIENVLDNPYYLQIYNSLSKKLFKKSNKPASEIIYDYINYFHVNGYPDLTKTQIYVRELEKKSRKRVNKKKKKGVLYFLKRFF